MTSRTGHRPIVKDLFAGAGLLSYAFKMEGFEVNEAIEIERFAAATYAENIGSHIRLGDVSKIELHGGCDVLVAGPPCQGFSRLGRDDDPRNHLSLEIVRHARTTKASVVVIENVPAFVSSPVWKRLAAALRRLGYEVEARAVNAVDFGVPQYRQRSFTIATKRGMPPPLSPRQGTPQNVREAWAGLPTEPDDQNHHYSPKPSELALSRMRVIPPGGDRRDVLRLAPHLAPRSWLSLRSNDVTDVWGRLEWAAPSNTLKTTLQNPSKGRYIHPEANRVISLREAARLHSIPDSWTFSGPPYPIARQIGNSVPPSLGRAIARATRHLF